MEPVVKSSNWIPLVVCAANRRKDGLIVCGARHYDPIMRAMMAATGGRDAWISSEQGFIDAKGKFLTREEAHTLAKENGQIKYRCGGDEDILFSENLY